jgi:predicted Zn-dependent peptidase
MIALTLALTLGRIQAPDDGLKLLRTKLDNNATVIAEQVPGMKRTIVQLWCSSRDSIDSPKTFGYRHMLEHLVARLDRTIDTTLESAGGMLNCATFRSGMQFEIAVDSGSHELVLATLRKLSAYPTFTPDLIKAEARTLSQEAILRSKATNESALHWLALGGKEAVDPAGPEEWEEAPTPAQLTAVYRKMMSASNLTLVISGDEPVDVLTQKYKGWLSTMPVYELGEPEFLAPQIVLDRVSKQTESVGLGVPGFFDTRTFARLAACLAFLSEARDGYLLFTPSGDPGVITVGSRLGIEELKRVKPTQLTVQVFNQGKNLLLEWLRTLKSNPSKWAEVRGLLQCSGTDPILRAIETKASQISFMEFAEAYKLLEKGL